MYTDREEFEGWMQRIMQRFDTTEKLPMAVDTQSVSKR